MTDNRRATDDKRPLAVFDLDGTLAETAHRQHFLEAVPKDWDGFFGAAGADTPLAEGVALVLKCAEECEIVYLTGRPERCRDDTLTWLRANGLPDGQVFMRRNHDRRPARTTKVERLRKLAAKRGIRMLVDDDELVCDAVERAGFRVVRARWASTSQALRDGQEREGRT
ncbi:HAD family acid phosphatase [Streptomyces sp. NBC_01506]|uniref:phosphatase domain-containing protein n=1 Tax=Streptomyces sp. NBC_01506 TaxID=2903887 RepID=UPI0038669AE2